MYCLYTLENVYIFGCPLSKAKISLFLFRLFLAFILQIKSKVTARRPEELGIIPKSEEDEEDEEQKQEDVIHTPSPTDEITSPELPSISAPQRKLVSEEDQACEGNTLWSQTFNNLRSQAVKVKMQNHIKNMFEQSKAAKSIRTLWGHS